MNLADIETLDKEFLSPEEVGLVLGADPISIRNIVKLDKTLLGFPAIVMGTRIRIPKEAFLFFCRFGRVLYDGSKEAAILCADGQRLNCPNTF